MNGAEALVIGNCRVAWRCKIDEECLIRFICRIAVYFNSIGPRRNAGREGDRAGGGTIIIVGYCCASVRRSEVDGNCLTARLR